MIDTLPSADPFTGLTALATVMQMKPDMQISFYTYGIILRRLLPDGGETEYPVSPAQVAAALSAKIQFDSGILSGNTLWIGTEGVKKVVVEYRAPQKTALFVEGSEQQLRIALPGLVMFRTTVANDSPKYRIYAVKKRPETKDAPLFLAPLPNTDRYGICWGTVKKVSGAALTGNALADDWAVFLGSVFTNHSLAGKSKAHPTDIRKAWIEIEQKKRRVYPSRDLVKADLTFGAAMEEALR